MKEKEKMLAISVESAPTEDSIDAETIATLSTSQSGEERLDAEGKSDKDAEFEALIENEYKEQFSKKVQKIISKRLREVKSVKEEHDKNTLLVQSLLKKFNIEDGDTEKLERMIDEAMEKIPTEDKKAELIKRLVAENRYLKSTREEERRDMETKSRAGELRKQVEETKAAYPDFDIEKEIKNPEFTRLIRLGVNVKNAYEVSNIDAILQNNFKTAEKKVVDSIRHKANRPVENGSEGASGILLSGNASKLTKKQRADLAKRAAKGEKISF